MQNKKFWLLAASLLLVVGCANNKPKDNKLKFSVDANETGIQWAAVNGATGYRATLEGEDPEELDEPFYKFEETEGEYKVLIEALKGEKVLKKGTFDYETIETYISDIDYDDGVIHHANDYVGKEILWKFNEGEWQEFTQDIDASQTGYYVVKGSRGWVEERHVYYPKDAFKGICLADDAGESYDLEDGQEASDEALKALYEVKEYKKVSDDPETYDWAEPDGADLALADYQLFEDNVLFNGKGAKLSFKGNGNFYRFEKALHLTESYKGLTFKAKATRATTLVLSLQIAHDVNFGPINLKGVYLKYTVELNPSWTLYNINFDDTAWKVPYGTGELSIPEVMYAINAGGVQLSAIGDLLQVCDSFQIKLKNTLGSNVTAEAIFDNMALIPVKPVNEKVKIVEPFNTLQDEYFIKNNAITAQIADVNGATPMLHFTNSGNKVSLPVTLEINNKYQVRVVSSTSGFDFDALFNSFDGGLTFSYASGTGTLSNMLAGAEVFKLNMLEDFESYSATGVGYDQSHGKDARSGLRAAFYADYYTGGENDSSPVGGKGWKLMGSSDYLNLETTNVFLGGKAGSFKHGTNTMRFISWSITEEPGATTGVCGYGLYFWYKSSNADEDKGTISVRAFDRKLIDAKTQQTGKTADASVVKTSNGWKLAYVPLSYNATYYGFSITTKSGPSSAKRIYIDNIFIA